MSRAFYRPRGDNTIETFGGSPFFHEKSQQHMEIVQREGGLLFRRFQIAPDGKPINLVEQRVDWILGSGHHSRTYLFQTPSGEIYQLPLAWYSQISKWGMAPGYDRADHEGVARRVRHECLFCHNAYPEIAAQPGSYWRSQSLPEELPEGIGCQRCHGPGANHIRAVTGGKQEEIHTSIVNPAKLEPARRNDVCYECHMQPSVALSGLRRFDKDIYSFRPGAPLSDYFVHLDVTEKGLPRAERFEINHHPYRLEQSRCFRESAARLSCLSCHDPHRKIPHAERAEHYRNVCVACHAAQHDEAMRATADCVSCHMPQRRTQDVVHVVMTDHFIRATPGGAELLAPLDEREPDIDDVHFLDPKLAPPAPLGDLYRSSAIVRASGGSSVKALRRLEQMIAEARPAEIEPYLDLAMAQLKQRQIAELEKTAELIVGRAPANAQALEWLGVARFALGRQAEGIALIEKALKLDPRRAETHFNLGLLLYGQGKKGAAISHFERAVSLRPNLAAAWFHLGEARLDAKRFNDAVAAYRRALAIDPTHTRAYAAIGRALIAAGNRDEALRYWQHGAKAAARPETIVKLLEENSSRHD